MKRAALLGLLVLLTQAAGASTPRPSDGGAVRYRTVAIALETTLPLAAWQLELVAEGDARIVGVEGGAAAPFLDPPLYDPAALAHGRIILAAFDTHAALPAGRHRVAIVHLREAGAEVRYRVQLIAAGDPGGGRIAAVPSFEIRSSTP